MNSPLDSTEQLLCFYKSFLLPPDSLMLHQTDFLLDFHKYATLNMLRYPSLCFLGEGNMVNSRGLTDCVVTESSAVLGVSSAPRLL